MESRVYDICLSKYKKENYLETSWDELAQMVGYDTGEQLRGQFRRTHQKVLIETSEEDEETEYREEEPFDSRRESQSYEEGKDFINIICASKRILSKDDIIEQFNIDMSKWEIERFKVKTSEAYRKDRSVSWHVLDGKVEKGDVEDSGKMLIVPLYHVEVKMKRKNLAWNKENTDRLFERLEIRKPQKIEEHKYSNSSEDMFFLPIADLHLGLLATEKVCGNEYNISKAIALCKEAVSKAITKIKMGSYEKIVLLIGNDFLNSDNVQGTTTRGTPQDNDGFWYEMTDAAIDLIIDVVQSLTPYAPVEIHSVYSNHDEQTMYGVMKAVQLYFKDNKNISCCFSPFPRSYIKFGKNLIGITHDISIKKSLEVITTEAKDMWSNSTHMFWILAHLHNAMTYEKQGYLEIMRLPTISGRSRWTIKNGYTQTDKKTQCFVFNKEDGLTDIINILVS